MIADVAAVLHTPYTALRTEPISRIFRMHEHAMRREGRDLQILSKLLRR